MTAADLLNGALALIRNTLGAIVPADLTDPGRPVALAPGGRLTVAPGQTIASTWGNTVFDQSVICFASAADRDNQWPSPHNGSVCWLDDLKILCVYNGTAWRYLPSGAPLAQANASSNGSSASGALVQIPGTAGSFTLPGARRVWVDINSMMSNSVGTAQSRVNGRIDGVVCGQIQATHTQVGGSGQVQLGGGQIMSLAAGAHTFDAAVSAPNGGTASAINTAIMIRDLGP